MLRGSDKERRLLSNQTKTAQSSRFSFPFFLKCRFWGSFIYPEVLKETVFSCLCIRRAKEITLTSGFSLSWPIPETKQILESNFVRWIIDRGIEWRDFLFVIVSHIVRGRYSKTNIFPRFCKRDTLSVCVFVCLWGNTGRVFLSCDRIVSVSLSKIADQI